MSSESLILELSSNLAPVRRRRMLPEAAIILALGGIELALFFGLGLMRPDIGSMASSPYLLWRSGSLAILAIVACTVAIRSYSPTAQPRRGLMLAYALAALAAVGGIFVAPAGVGDLTLIERLDPARGLLCSLSIIALSLPIIALLGALMRNAAPTQPRRSALASGIAAGTIGALIFAFCCPINDPLYVVVWYGTGCAAVAGAARWRLTRRFSL